MNTSRCFLPLRLSSLALFVGPAAGCPLAAVGVGDVAVQEDVHGDSTSETAIDDVRVDEADVDVDADTDVNNHIVVNIGGDRDDADDERNDDERNDDEGTATATGDEIAFEYHYEGPFEERVVATPSFGDVAVSSVEWLARGVVFDEPTIFDDAAGFAWGEPQDDGAYVLAVRFTDAAATKLVWTPATKLCASDDDDGATCVGRAVSAACAADLVLRVWLEDGTAREVAMPHTSARPTCQ